jgi:hypothetical protein
VIFVSVIGSEFGQGRIKNSCLLAAVVLVEERAQGVCPLTENTLRFGGVYYPVAPGNRATGIARYLPVRRLANYLPTDGII